MSQKLKEMSQDVTTPKALKTLIYITFKNVTETWKWAKVILTLAHTLSETTKDFTLKRI